MTQEVQPLTWSKRTNLEEHQQFFTKINEIIDNLAPTVDEAEQAIAQATAAIASANDAMATANAASAAASAAASQAQTAASTVAGYDGRLTAAEGDIDSLQTADTQNVKINRINEYAVGLTGNQDNILGVKQFTGDGNLRMRTPNLFFQANSILAHNADRGNQHYLFSGFFNDADGNRILRLGVQEAANGKLYVYLGAYDTSDVQVIKTLGIFNYTTGQWEA